jgi:hypothetical protein
MVQVSINDSGAWSEWIDTGNFVISSSSWAPLSVDLTQYAGKKMRIAFQHNTYSYYNAAFGPDCRSASNGWYIDNVEIITNAIITPCRREP